MAHCFPSLAVLDADLSSMVLAADDTSLDKGKGELKDAAALETLRVLLRLASEADAFATPSSAAPATIITAAAASESPEQDTGSDDDQDDSSSSNSEAAVHPSLRASLVELGVPLPPRPSELCECHGQPRAQCTRPATSCRVCFDDIEWAANPRPYHSPQCHLYLCEACLTDVIGNRINNGETDSLRCPHCSYYILAREVNERCGPKEVEQYHRFQLRKMLAKSHDLHACSSPGCENAVFYDNECALKGWQCEQCAVQCSFCKGPAHVRGERGCDASRNFRKAERSYAVWTAMSVSKRCPSCKTPIIKRGGCPHMSCQNCKHQWCWHCKRDWNTHGMCIYAKILLGGALVLSPALAVLAGAALLAVCAPLMVGQALLPTTVLPGRVSGKSIVRAVWRYGRKVLRNL